MVKELFAEDYEGVGGMLARARRDAGLSVADVGYNLRIRDSYITAIESGRFQELPGRAYALGFVRGYAEFLGMDAEYVVRQYRQETTWWRSAPRKEFTAIEPIREESRPRVPIVIGAVVVLLALYGYWYTFFFQPNTDGVVLRAPEEVLRPDPPDPAMIELMMRADAMTPLPQDGACTMERLANRTLRDAIAHCKIMRSEYYTFLYQWLEANKPVDAPNAP